MRYWVFTEEQLQAALTEYCARISEPAVDETVVAGFINEFLVSPEAAKHKLQGGASYQPEPR